MPAERFNNAIEMAFQAFENHDRDAFEEAIFDAKFAVLWKEKEEGSGAKTDVFVLLDEARDTFPGIRALDCLTKAAIALVAPKTEHRQNPDLPPATET